LDAVMLSVMDDAAELRAFLSDPRVKSVCLGPGLGLERARCLVPAVLEAGVPAVVDADAMTAFADRPDQLFRLLHRGCLLTPHDGEFARVFPDLAAGSNRAPKPDMARTADGDRSRGEAARSAARRAGCAVLLKGPQTWIASPDGDLHPVRAPEDGSAAWLATAGSGDVLAGFCTGLLARGMDPVAAGRIGALLHLECGRSIGPGLIAEDIPEALPRVFRRIGCGVAQSEQHPLGPAGGLPFDAPSGVSWE
jgi:NAD(P)H-hydrate repair Nnr-like enzyme with NAD(P)H-hydrate dehydratase domain